MRKYVTRQINVKNIRLVAKQKFSKDNEIDIILCTNTGNF